MTSADKTAAIRAGVALSAVAEGGQGRVVRVDAGHGLVARLSALGLVPGAQVLVVTNCGKGPLIVEVKGARLALGRGMAAKILVKCGD